MNTIKENLIELFELEKLSAEKGAEMVERLGKLVFQSVLVRVLPMLSELELNEYEKIINGKAEFDTIIIFLSEKIPDFDKIIKEETESLRDEMANEMAP